MQVLHPYQLLPLVQISISELANQLKLLLSIEYNGQIQRK